MRKFKEWMKKLDQDMLGMICIKLTNLIYELSRNWNQSIWKRRTKFHFLFINIPDLNIKYKSFIFFLLSVFKNAKECLKESFNNLHLYINNLCYDSFVWPFFIVFLLKIIWFISLLPSSLFRRYFVFIYYFSKSVFLSFLGSRQPNSPSFYNSYCSHLFWKIVYEV